MLDWRPRTTAGSQRSERAYSIATASSLESPELIVTITLSAVPISVTVIVRMARAALAISIPACDAKTAGSGAASDLKRGGANSLLAGNSGLASPAGSSGSSSGAGTEYEGGTTAGIGASSDELTSGIFSSIRIASVTVEEAIACRLRTRGGDSTNCQAIGACSARTSSTAVIRIANAPKRSVIRLGVDGSACASSTWIRRLTGRDPQARISSNQARHGASRRSI
jgi:hypothetical protein